MFFPLIVVLGLVFWKVADQERHSPGGGLRSEKAPEVPARSPAEDAAVISKLVTEEETYLKLTPKMNALSRGLMNLRLPGPGEESVFAGSVFVSDIGPAPAAPSGNARTLQKDTWPMNDSPSEVTGVDLWRPLLDSVYWFEHAKVYIASGEHPAGDAYKYEAIGKFEALANMKSEEWRSIEGTIEITWERSRAAAGEPVGDWRITGWKTKRLEFLTSPKRLFVEVLDKAMRGGPEAAKLRRSLHYEATVQYYRSGMSKPPHPYFAPISVNQKEGLAIVDINGDGFDDIYITVRIGKNMLLVNQRDGTFIEQAAQYKLDLPGHTTCALFADFDNDGDQDVILGRSLLKTSYLENRDGVFYQHPIPSFMPMAVISMAAADYNRDGLLDVYLCTYRPAAPAGDSPAGGVAQGKEGDFDWPDEFFSPELAREFRRRLAEHRQINRGTVLDQIGPPNVLLINRGGGRLEPAPENNTIEVWRNSLQATWGDYDQDGDPDLFVANDWAASSLFRNNGPAGFADISGQSGVTSYGFSMGASWGDYDNDGLEDVYVSNMHSDAGMRMCGKIPGLSKMFVESASGNWLYHQTAPGKFEQLSGTEPPAMTVIDAGWSWGGCFADFDNDTFLDLYVLSGYFTAPKELASEIDLESNLWRTMLRTDVNLARASFRFSPEWKRTGPPDNFGPQIDARLAGVDRQGDKVQVHSLQGSERNHYFANRDGRVFEDISGLSGLDNIADSRGFALLDYDRDGRQDVALVNANEPLFNLYHNETSSLRLDGGMIAIRFVGGSRTAAPSGEFACRDGYGTRVSVNLGESKLIREHRCGDGWSTQNSATMIVGIGTKSSAAMVTVRWPSGKTSVAKDVPEGTLLTVFENPADGPGGEAFARAEYRTRAQIASGSAEVERPVFPIARVDPKAKMAMKLRIYTSFTTTSQAFKDQIPQQQLLKDQLADEGVEIVAIPTDPADDNSRLGVFASEYHPPARLINFAPSIRNQAVTAFREALGGEAPAPSSVITDGLGRILATQAGVPTISEARKWLDFVGRRAE